MRRMSDYAEMSNYAICGVSRSHIKVEPLFRNPIKKLSGCKATERRILLVNCAVKDRKVCSLQE